MWTDLFSVILAITGLAMGNLFGPAVRSVVLLLSLPVPVVPLCDFPALRRGVTVFALAFVLFPLNQRARVRFCGQDWAFLVSR